MPSATTRILWLVPVLLLALLPLAVLLRLPPEVKKPPVHSSQTTPPLSPLAETPDWSALEVYQGTITRADFERLMREVFTLSGKWREFIRVEETEAVVDTGTGAFHLRFASGNSITPPRPWRTAADLPPAPADQPLTGLHIALDPGHIGGKWAQMEERWLSVNGSPPVCEGDMTLAVAKLLKPQLEAMGATVTLVRETTEPVTTVRPAELMERAAKEDAANAQKVAERLFYRTAEIRARAELVNKTIKPDVLVCLHFNAEAWGAPTNPTLINRHHLHLILNGAYGDDEIVMADQRFALLKKLLERTHEEEALIGSRVATTFACLTGLPAYEYPTGSVRRTAESPYLWCRNLLANRLYDCPVIYMEPYVMNSTLDHPRMTAGDYDGLRDFGAERRQSIFREYANAVAEGLAAHFRSQRAVAR